MLTENNFWSTIVSRRYHSAMMFVVEGCWTKINQPHIRGLHYSFVSFLETKQKTKPCLVLFWIKNWPALKELDRLGGQTLQEEVRISRSHQIAQKHDNLLPNKFIRAYCYSKMNNEADASTEHKPQFGNETFQIERNVRPSRQWLAWLLVYFQNLAKER